jgi:RNA polymerase sigma factor (sigma-70 family)
MAPGPEVPVIRPSSAHEPCQDWASAGNKWARNPERPVAQQTAEEIFTKIYRDHHDLVLAYCARRVSAHEADDATSEVFAVLWRRIREIDSEQPLPWLYGVARNTLAHRWRSRSRWQRLLDRLGGSPDPSTASTEEVVVRREQDRLVLLAVAQLSPTIRRSSASSPGRASPPPNAPRRSDARWRRRSSGYIGPSRDWLDAFARHSTLSPTSRLPRRACHETGR